ncbi:UvrB/UvrC motif-containing protein [candidate division FCPU426 bacterium]|nr:UvrB/UvrC motif-containing protein [candidate division FCPU426 bacterium]
MQCQLCHQEEANVYLIETINGKQTAMHICETCAQKRHLGEMLAKPAMAIHDILASILELGATAVTEAVGKCPRCGTTFAHFREVGRFGCADCYDAFRENLLPLFRQFHKSEEHRGRRQYSQELEKKRKQRELKEIKDQLHHAITGEQFELAAQLRDRIRHLEGREK